MSHESACSSLLVLTLATTDARWCATLALLVALAVSGCSRDSDTNPAASDTNAAPASGTSAGAQRPPNVVLITVESLRTDYVGAYGGKSRSRPEVPLTPNIDALAKEGVVYEDGHSVTSWTLASHASLFTGLYPSAHQTIHATDKLGDSYETLAERLAARGYDTAGVISGPYLRRAHNLNQGFAHYHDEIASQTQVQAHGEVTNPRMEVAIRHVIEHEIDPKRPFMLFAYFWDTHYDYLPPQPFDSMFTGPDCEPINVHNYETSSVVNPSITPGQLAYVLSQYAGEVRETDEALGRFFQLLKDKGLWDDTAIIVTADHGEEFFDHGEKGHFNNIYAETVHVPLIVKYPKGGPQGRDGRLASLVDIVPTVLELVGAPQVGGAPLAGQSLLLQKPDEDRAIFYELLSVWYSNDSQWAKVPAATRTRRWKGIRRGNYKLVVSPQLGRREVYDVRIDPAEKVDVSAANSSVVQQLGSNLKQWKESQRLLAAIFKKGGAAPLSDAETERLRALGYIQ